MEETADVAIHGGGILGIPLGFHKPDEIQRRWPYLNVADLKGDTFFPEDGYADPNIEGFYNAIGFSGHGFTTFDLTPFFSEQFTKGPLQGEKRVV